MVTSYGHDYHESRTDEFIDVINGSAFDKVIGDIIHNQFHTLLLEYPAQCFYQLRQKKTKRVKNMRERERGPVIRIGGMIKLKDILETRAASSFYSQSKHLLLRLTRLQLFHPLSIKKKDITHTRSRECDKLITIL